MTCDCSRLIKGFGQAILPMFHKGTGHWSGSRLLCIFLNGLLISLYSGDRKSVV